MKKIFIAPIGVALLFALTGIAVGETTNTTGVNPVSSVKKEIRDERAQFKTNVVAPIKNDIKDLRAGGVASSTELKEKIRNALGEIKEKRQEFKAEVKKKLAAAARARLNRKLDKMSEDVSRNVNVNTRIESRITKLQTAGKDVALSTAALALAKDKAATATLAIETAKANIASIAPASTTDINMIKEYVKTAEEAVRAAKFATAKAISTLKGFGEPDRAENDSGTAPTTKEN